MPAPSEALSRHLSRLLDDVEREIRYTDRQLQDHYGVRTASVESAEEHRRLALAILRDAIDALGEQRL